MSARISAVFGLLLPRTRTSLWHALRSDCFPLVATLILFVTACIPLFVTPFLPFADPVPRARSSLGLGTKLVLERARWRIYRVTKPEKP
jgi:hypothetical protein